MNRILFSSLTLAAVLSCKLAQPEPKAPTPTAIPAPAEGPSMAPVDEFLGRCPTGEQIAEIDSDLELKFEGDPTSDQALACSAAQGSADLTLFQKRIYNTLLVMKQLRFTLLLPWTHKALYTWVADTIEGIRFRSDITNSFCCEPINFVNIQTNNLVANVTDRWIEPASGGGLRDLLVLFAHETRHNEGKVHTCDNIRDNSLSEMGAWAVQYYLDLWLANYTLDPTFFSAPDADYFALTAEAADHILATRFCLEPVP